VPTDVVVDTSIDTPAPIDTPIIVPSSRRNNPSRKTHLQSKTFKLCKKAKEKSSQRLMKLCGKRTNSAREDC
jgi:hypothetical protein